MNCSMFVVWGILIITAAISVLLYNVHHGSETPDIGPYKHSVCIGGCTQPCESWRCAVSALEALEFSSSSGMECVTASPQYVCVLFVVLYCYFTCREIVDQEQALSPPVS